MEDIAQGIQAMFVCLAAESTDAVRISEIAVSIWDGVGVALSPIIGQTGVAALFKRSVYLTRIAHPCLSVVCESALPSEELALLQEVLAQQGRIEAVAVNLALLQSFNELLVSLIGASLSERLLRAVWDNPSAGDAVQETMR